MLNSAEETWSQLLNDIQSFVNKQTFEMWLKETKAIDLHGDVITIQVQDEVAKKHIKNTHESLISSILHDISGKNIYCNLVIKGDEPQSPQEKIIIQNPIKQNSIVNMLDSESMLNPHYTFETFVIGPNNQLAHAAAESISKAPATQYNPLFMYGSSGLGKTHLMQAIGHAIMKEKPFLKVLYVTSEQFVNEFINAIRNNTIQSFKIKYRNVDILLIDDIQFISKKEQTQEEFFHTFNDLHNNNKQIIISSDRPPRELSYLTERLRTRFEWGLIADIQPPNLETREAILRKKAEIEDIIITDEVLNYIARRIKSNIRALESSLKKLHVVASVHNEPITIQLANMHLKPLFEETYNKRITVSEIIQKVSENYNVTVEDIVSKSRQNSIVQPRFVAMYLSTKLTNLTTTEIGSQFGKRDHSTVINARNNIENAIKNNEALKELIDDITSELKN